MATRYFLHCHTIIVVLQPITNNLQYENFLPVARRSTKPKNPSFENLLLFNKPPNNPDFDSSAMANPSSSLLAFLVLGLLLCASAHGGHGDDDAESDSPPPNLRSRSLILVKVWCLIIAFAATFAGGISPYFLKWNEPFLSFGTLFAGGVFLGTALMHFLSDSNSTFEDLTDKEYPFAFMLASAGYLVTMLADCLIAGVVARGRSVRDVEGGEILLPFSLSLSRIKICLASGKSKIRNGERNYFSSTPLEKLKEKMFFF